MAHTTIENHTGYCHTDLLEMNDDLLSPEAYKLKAGAVAWTEGYFTESEIIEALTDKYIGNGLSDETYELFTDQGEDFAKKDASDLIFELGWYDEPAYTERNVLDRETEYVLDGETE
jgi:hypothetical protein